ncbi:MAG: BatD family protein [Chromatiaceae bacterium]
MKHPVRSSLVHLMVSARAFPWPVLLAFLVLWVPALSVAAEVNARISASSIPLGQTLNLTLEANGQLSSSPDLSVLRGDFDIVNRRAQRSVSVINGQRSERYMLTLILRPRRAGALQIPAIPFGDTATQPLRLAVTGASAEQQPAPAADESAPATPPVVLETEVDAPKVWIRQQVVLTARVLMGAPVAGMQLHDPEIPHATVLPLGEDRYTATRDGQDYSVYERRYAVFPQDAGYLKIPPLELEGWSGDTAGITTSSYGYGGQTVRAESKPLGIQVLPAPQGKRSAGWLPARSVSLTETGPATYRVGAGQPVERQITLRVDGIRASDLPAIAVPAPYELVKRPAPPRLWDERHPEGVVGVRQEVIRLATNTPGRYRLPPFSLEWWNTKSGGWESAMLPARDLVVTAGSGTDWVSGSPPAAADAPHPTETERPARRDTGWGASIWVTLVLGLAWVATMLAWWRSRHRPERATPVPTPETVAPSEPQDAEPASDAITAVRTAYEAENAATAREALLTWAKEIFPENPPSNLARLAQRCNEPLRGHILMLEQTFFSPRPLPWSHQPVWQALGNFEPAPPEEPATFRRAKPLRRRASV